MSNVEKNEPLCATCGGLRSEPPVGRCNGSHVPLPADAPLTPADGYTTSVLHREIDALRAELNQYKEAGEVFAARVYAEREAEREAEINALRAQIAEHKCSLPDSINESLNSGDGTYRP